MIPPPTCQTKFDGRQKVGGGMNRKRVSAMNCAATLERDPRKLVETASMQLLAHDMKNVLSGIIGNTQILLMDKREREEAEILNDVLKSAEKLNQMVRNVSEAGFVDERTNVREG